MTELTRKDLVVGGVYRAKKPRRCATGNYDDRVILHMDMLGWEVQYDSDSIGLGRHYPKTTTEKFLKWAKERIE